MNWPPNHDKIDSCLLYDLSAFINFSGRPKGQDNASADSVAKSKNEVTSINDVLKGLVDWLCAQVIDLSVIFS